MINGGQQKSAEVNIFENLRRAIRAKRASRPGNIYCLFKSKPLQSSPTRINLRKAHRSIKPLDKQTITKSKTYDESSSPDESLGDMKPFDLTPVLRKIKMMECQSCGRVLEHDQEKDMVCASCSQLSKLVSTDNFAKFMDYVLAFKMGRPLPEPNRRSIKRLQSLDSITSMVVQKGLGLSNKLKTSTATDTIVFSINGIRLGESTVSHKFGNSRGNSKGNSVVHSKQLTPPSIKKKQLQRRETLKKSTGSGSSSTAHVGFFCDNCMMTPIVGLRYHCLTCSDFDLCESCYFQAGHKHEMETCNDKKKAANMHTVKQNMIKQSTRISVTPATASVRNLKFIKGSKTISSNKSNELVP